MKIYRYLVTLVAVSLILPTLVQAYDGPCQSLVPREGFDILSPTGADQTVVYVGNAADGFVEQYRYTSCEAYNGCRPGHMGQYGFETFERNACVAPEDEPPADNGGGGGGGSYTPPPGAGGGSPDPGGGSYGGGGGDIPCGTQGTICTFGPFEPIEPD